MLVSLILGGLIGYIISKQPVTVSNFPEQQKKEISYIINYSKSLLMKSEYSDNSKLKIHYEDIEVTNPYLINLTVKNTGDYEILNDDFQAPLTISLGAKILECEISNSSNDYILEEVSKNSKIEDTKFIISDFLLNPNEQFTLTFIIDNNLYDPFTAVSKVSYDYRINGISEFSKESILAEVVEELKK